MHAIEKFREKHRKTLRRVQILLLAILVLSTFKDISPDPILASFYLGISVLIWINCWHNRREAI